LQPLVIGHSKRPRCFVTINISNLPVIYKYNSKAWMRSDIWVSWLKHINEEFQNKNRQILLLVDNASSHSLNDGETPLQLSNITLQYLPPNTTSHLQPLDAGIIKSFKAKYKHLYCSHVLRQFESGIDIEKSVTFQLYFLHRFFLISFFF
jgi:hypothetical protein